MYTYIYIYIYIYAYIYINMCIYECLSLTNLNSQTVEIIFVGTDFIYIHTNEYAHAQICVYMYTEMNTSTYM